MRYEVDSYTLEYVEDEDKYYISFRDSVEQDCRIEIDKDIFDTYTNSKKAYIKIKNETSTQFRRIDLHIVNEITIRDVAKLEKVQKSQIQKSLELGLKKIKKFFEE